MHDMCRVTILPSEPHFSPLENERENPGTGGRCGVCKPVYTCGMEKHSQTWLLGKHWHRYAFIVTYHAYLVYFNKHDKRRASGIELLLHFLFIPLKIQNFQTSKWQFDTSLADTTCMKFNAISVISYKHNKVCKDYTGQEFSVSENRILQPVICCAHSDKYYMLFFHLYHVYCK